MTVIDIALTFAFASFGLGLLLNLWRIFYAPGVPDRILALDTMVINVIALIILYGIRAGTSMYFEAAMLFAMTGFVSTVAYAKFILRGDIIE
ncbi:MAG: K+/H+ antiporter subunit F [Gemmobacter sp.]